MAEKTVGICLYCGESFIKNTGGQKFCCAQCRTAKRNEDRAMNPSPRKMGWKPKKESEIARINRLAREMNLSYGQYVIRYGGGADVRGKEVSTASQTV